MGRDLVGHRYLPNASAVPANFLSGVTCISTADCWAVGYAATGSAQTLIEHWDGTWWGIVTPPTQLWHLNNGLYAVTCVSASDCWAVGDHYSSGNGTQTLIEHWDGTSWAIVASPNALTAQNFLSGVTCISASECWAVGYSSDPTSGVDQTLIERWDGTSWTIVISPNALAAQQNILQSVTCVSASECWAVGYAGSINYQDARGAVGWDLVGHRHFRQHQRHAEQPPIWGDMRVRRGGLLGRRLLHQRQQCQADPDRAVGRDLVGHRHFAQHQRPAEQLPLRGDVRVGVRLLGGRLPLVGGAATLRRLSSGGTGPPGPSSPRPTSSAAQQNILQSVTCASASECWAVGYFIGSSGVRTLIERYTTISPLTPTSVVSRKTHGTAGDFDIDLPLIGNPGIECRTGGASGDHQVVITFPSAVTFASASVTSGAGAVASSSGSGTTALTVNLTGVSNAQTITLTLSGVNDGTTTGDIGLRMGVLLGDVNGNGAVSNTDVASVKAEVSAPVTASNFRTDVNANGMISNTDVSTTKAQVSTTLP